MLPLRRTVVGILACAAVFLVPPRAALALGVTEVLVDSDPGALAIVSRSPETVADGQLELRVNGLSAAFTAIADGATPLPVVVTRADLGLVVLDVSGLPNGAHRVLLTDGATGATATACFTVAADHAECTVGGTLRDPAGQPAAGVLVRLGTNSGSFLKAAVTGADGTWSLAVPGVLRYENSWNDGAFLRYVPPAGAAGGWGETYWLSCGSALDEQLPEAWPVTGIVHDAAGRPLPNARVAAWDADVGVVTGADGSFTLPAAGETDFTVTPPPGTRLLLARTRLVVNGPADAGILQTAAGRMAWGSTRDLLGRPIATTVAAWQSGQHEGEPAARGVSDSCTGDFRIARPPDGLLTAGRERDGWRQLEWRELPADEDVVLDAVRVPLNAGLQLPSDEPHINAFHIGEAQAGQPLLLEVENVGDGSSTVRVLFSGPGGTEVPGTGTLVDPPRGRVLTTVPDDAVTGPVVLEVVTVVDGADVVRRSPPATFTRLDGTYPAGEVAESGVVYGSGVGPVGGVWVLAYRQDPAYPPCRNEAWPRYLVAATVTGPDGRWALTVPPGLIDLQYAPPPHLPLIGNMDWFTAGDRPGGRYMGLYTPLRTMTVQVGGHDDFTGDFPVPRARVRTRFETRVADDDGMIVIPIWSDYSWTVEGPWLSRLGTVEARVPYSGTWAHVRLLRNVFVQLEANGAEGLPLPAPAVVGNTGEARHRGASTLTGFVLGALVPGGERQLSIVPRDETQDQIDLRLTADTDVVLRQPRQAGPAAILSGVIRAPDGAPSLYQPIRLFPGSLASPPRTAEACTDGSYRIRAPLGDVVLQLDSPPFMERFAQGWVGATGTVYCAADVTPLPVTGSRTLDITLARAGNVSGHVVRPPDDYNEGEVTLALGPLGSCTPTVRSNWYDGSYLFRDVPVGSGYRASVAVPGRDVLCYEGNEGCATFTPITLTTAGRSDIDFDVRPVVREITGLGVQRTGTWQWVTFAKSATAVSYNVYTGSLAADHVPAPPVAPACALTGPALTDNGNGTLTYGMALPEGDAAWTLVSGTNGYGEGTLGTTAASGWTLCSATP